jgi:hypothetical protein
MFTPGSGFGFAPQFKAPPLETDAQIAFALVRDTTAGGGSAFVGQVLSLLARVSVPTASPASATATAQDDSVAVVGNAASIAEMAVAASTSASPSGVLSGSSTATVTNAASLVSISSAQPTVVTEVEATSSVSTQSIPMLTVAQPAVILAKPETPAVQTSLMVVASAVQTATGAFAPAAQLMTPVIQAIENSGVTTVAYNFVRFDPATFLSGTVADLTAELTNISPSITANPFGTDARWVWALTGAVVAADLILVAHWQIRRARTLRHAASAATSIFSTDYVSEYVRE